MHGQGCRFVPAALSVWAVFFAGACRLETQATGAASVAADGGAVETTDVVSGERSDAVSGTDAAVAVDAQRPATGAAGGQATARTGTSGMGSAGDIASAAAGSGHPMSSGAGGAGAGATPPVGGAEAAGTGAAGADDGGDRTGGGWPPWLVAGSGGPWGVAGRSGWPGVGGRWGTGGDAGNDQSQEPAAGSGGSAGPQHCGTAGNALCGSGEFCNFEPDAMCGESDGGGSCEPLPQGCTGPDAPVCGCDDHSYRSPCFAHVAGVSVKAQGLCPADECAAAGGHIAHGRNGLPAQCEAGEQARAASGGRADSVCCVPGQGGQNCGGVAGLGCADGAFCNYEPAAGGQGCDGSVSDPAGVCQAKPDACTQQYQPVCGCDHRSYPNACAAHAQGRAVLRDAACGRADCQAVGGMVRAGGGSGAQPSCGGNEVEFTWVSIDTRGGSVERALCCVRR